MGVQQHGAGAVAGIAGLDAVIGLDADLALSHKAKQNGGGDAYVP